MCRVEKERIVRTAAYNWGIDRILNRKGLKDEYELPLQPFNGAGVNIYVLDTGLDTGHCEWQESLWAT